MIDISKTAMTMNKLHLILMLASFGLGISSCDDIKEVRPEIYAEKVASEKLLKQNKSNDLDEVQTLQSEINLPANFAAKTQWSTFNRDEQVNAIKRIVVSYGGELQGLGYSNAKILKTADIYVLNADISEAERLKLTTTLSELVGAPIVINILDSGVIDAMGSLESSRAISH